MDNRTGVDLLNSFLNVSLGVLPRRRPGSAGGRSGATVANAWTPGFSSTLTVITAIGGFLLSQGHLFVDDEDLAHLLIELGVLPFKIAGDLVGLQGLPFQNPVTVRRPGRSGSTSPPPSPDPWGVCRPERQPRVPSCRSSSVRTNDALCVVRDIETSWG